MIRQFCLICFLYRNSVLLWNMMILGWGALAAKYWQFSVDTSEVDDDLGRWPYAESFCRERGREMINLGLGTKHPENILLPRYGSSQVIFGVGDKTYWKQPAQIWVISGLLSEESWQICESFARLASSMAEQSPKINFTSWSFLQKSAFKRSVYLSD